MEQDGKPNGGSPRSGNSEALAKIARLISVGNESGLADDIDENDQGRTGDTAREDALSLEGLREPGAARLLEALPAGLAVCEGAKLIKVNTAFALAFGYPSPKDLEEAGGLKAVFPSEAKALQEHLSERSDTPKKPIELEARSRSGRGFSMPVAVHAIASDKDVTASLLVLHPDTSAFSAAPSSKQQKTQEDAEEPEKNVAETNRPATKRKKPRKRKKSGNKGGGLSQLDKMDFLAKVSHEVRTPLNSIIGFAEIMKEEQLGPIGHDRYRGYIRDIYDSGIYALSLVNDLLDISKIEAGAFELNFTAVDLDEVAAESVHSMQPQAQRQRVLLRTSFADDVPPVLADRRSIKQIILNLVSNAIKFTKPGGQVIVSTQHTGSGGVRIRVRDTGIGMSKGEIAVALEPFQQVETARRKHTGTGLGLPLTKALVEANRAKFKLRSVSNAGTRIDVTFPKDRVASAND